MPGFELFGDEERREVMDVLDTGILMRYGFDGARNGHWKAAELEAALCARLGVKHAHVCSSGTAAVATAMAAAGIGAGDEVICTPFTFVADIEMILQAGAIPVFAEIDETLCLDPASVEATITPKTKAVLVVHMCGSMARIDELAAVCERANVTLMEDAAQALGGTFKGKALGTFGAVGGYSFDFVKTITCGEGGAIVTDDPAIYDIAQAYTDHGHDHKGVDRGADLHPHIGVNYRISELHAAVGLAQLRKLDHILATQRRNAAYLRDGLSDLDHVTFRATPDPDGDTATFLSFMLPTEDDARRTAAELGQAGVDGCFYWYDNNWHYHHAWDHLKNLTSPAPLAGDRFECARDWARASLPASDAILGRTICMLIKLSWTEPELAERLERMRSVMAPAGTPS
ncbi:MAG: DegT/DnrJ/EryC1/StrS family aminotransferase [Planctomycetota bacterium]|jgi:8-amino-3,8-dideoxy-alpha-D-manno-octulosonate transaminase